MSSFRIDSCANLACKIYDSFSLEPDKELETRLNGIDELTRRLTNLLKLDEPDVVDCLVDFNLEFLPRFVHHSAALEGSTLSLADTQLAIEGEFLPSNSKELADLFSVFGSYQGYEKALERILAGCELDEEFIKDIHELTALDVQPRNRGSYRTTQVFITGSRTVPAAQDSIRPLMRDLLAAYERSSMHPIIKAAAFHALFENIHPFRDGNGRTGRILFNAMLVRDGYAPIAIKSEDKKSYLESLEAWQVDGDPSPLLCLTCSCVEKETNSRRDAIEQTLRVVPIAKEERAKRAERRDSITDGDQHCAYIPKLPAFGTNAQSIAEGMKNIRYR